MDDDESLKSQPVEIYLFWLLAFKLCCPCLLNPECDPVITSGTSGTDLNDHSSDKDKRENYSYESSEPSWIDSLKLDCASIEHAAVLLHHPGPPQPHCDISVFHWLWPISIWTFLFPRPDEQYHPNHSQSWEWVKVSGRVHQHCPLQLLHVYPVQGCSLSFQLFPPSRLPDQLLLLLHRRSVLLDLHHRPRLSSDLGRLLLGSRWDDLSRWIHRRAGGERLYHGGMPTTVYWYCRVPILES